MMSDKIRPHHLERKAILYVRQSSTHQVLHNRESSALQYAMRDRLVALGWSQIETVDDDLGRSAAGGHYPRWIRPHGRRGLPRQSGGRGRP
jgi:DNA invertase Pin-like site-specific DNA recombinase